MSKHKRTAPGESRGFGLFFSYDWVGKGTDEGTEPENQATNIDDQNRVGGEVALPVLPHHRTYCSVYGGSR